MKIWLKGFLSLVLVMGMLLSSLAAVPQTVSAEEFDPPNAYDIEIQRASIGTDNITQADQNSTLPSISADGSLVTFESTSALLVMSDGNSYKDVFVRNRSINTTGRASNTNDGNDGNEASERGKISSNGRYIVFESIATNLVANDTNGVKDIFVRDTVNHTTTRVSVSSGGVQGNGLSGGSAISGDGRYVVFASSASNLVAGDTNGKWDIFLHDLVTHITSRVSINGGIEGDQSSVNPCISDDGSMIGFESSSTTFASSDSGILIDVFVVNRATGSISVVSKSSAGVLGDNGSHNCSLSQDGRYVAFNSRAANLVSGDGNGVGDVFRHDRNTGTTIRVSVATGGIQVTGESVAPTISGDGDWIAFNSIAADMVNGDGNGENDVFVHHVSAGTTRRLSVSSAGVEGNGGSYSASMSLDGRYVAFESFASNLVTGDTNDRWDVFVAYAGDATITTPALRSPGADAIVYGGRPTYKWYPITGATAYDIEMYDDSSTLIGSWTKGVGACEGLTYCEYRISFDLETNYGDYFWRIKARNTTTGGYSQWSTLRKFTYTQLDRVTAYGPIDNLVTSNHYPSLIFSDITGATMYLVQFRLPDETFLFNMLIPDAGNCDGSLCIYTFDTPMDSGTYIWHMRAKNGRNFGRWTAYRTITIE